MVVKIRTKAETDAILASLQRKPAEKLSDNVWVMHKKGNATNYVEQLTFFDPKANAKFRKRKRCKIEDCSNFVVNGTYCSKHLHRIKKYGDPTRGDYFPKPGEKHFLTRRSSRKEDLTDEMKIILEDLQHFQQRSEEAWVLWKSCEIQWALFRRKAKKVRDHNYPQFRNVYEGVVHYERLGLKERNTYNYFDLRQCVDLSDPIQSQPDLDVTIKNGRKLYRLTDSYRHACDKAYENFCSTLEKSYNHHTPIRDMAKALKVSDSSLIGILERRVQNYRNKKLRRNFGKIRSNFEKYPWTKGLWWFVPNDYK